MSSFFGPPISVYTRADAIADGVLVDLTAKARIYGFKIPMAATSTVWHAISWPEDGSGQSTEGRLHDVLSIARLAADAAAKAGASVVGFEVLMVPKEAPDKGPVAVSMKLAVSGGDSGEPVLTLMYPEED